VWDGRQSALALAVSIAPDATLATGVAGAGVAAEITNGLAATGLASALAAVPPVVERAFARRVELAFVIIVVAVVILASLCALRELGFHRRGRVECTKEHHAAAGRARAGAAAAGGGHCRGRAAVAPLDRGVLGEAVEDSAERENVHVVGFRAEELLVPVERAARDTRARIVVVCM